KEVEQLLDTVGITLNKNTVPNEQRSPFVTSGVRIGTPAATTRGLKDDDMVELASIINDAIANRENDLTEVRNRIKALCDKYPLY
ncbi:MAG: serine hydroxymethyltransferase, partial [Sarcina sp.]